MVGISGAGPPQVLVRRVDERLRVGEIVQRRDQPVADADALVDDLDDRSQAVGRARGGGHDVVHRRVVQVIVDPHHDVEGGGILDRRRHHNLARAVVEVGLQRLEGLEAPGRLEHEVDAHVAPRNRGRVRLLRRGDQRAVDRDRRTLGGNGVRPAAVNGVELEQVRARGGVAVSFVDVDELELWPGPGGPQREPSHPTEAVDADADRSRHVRTSWGVGSSSVASRRSASARTEK